MLKLQRLSLGALLACSVTVFAGPLGGCGTGNQPGVEMGGASAKASKGAVETVELSPQQRGVLTAGVKQMAVNDGLPADGTVLVSKAFKVGGAEGVHVCGNLQSADSAVSGALPFYVELRDVAGQALAERGQVGSDDKKRAKVTFMCRDRIG